MTTDVSNESLLTMEEIVTMSDMEFWEKIGTLSHAQIRERVDMDEGEDFATALYTHLTERTVNWIPWHFLGEKAIRNILNEVIVDYKFSKKDLMDDVADDYEYVKEIRLSEGLTDHFELDNSLLFKVADEFIEEKAEEKL